MSDVQNSKHSKGQRQPGGSQAVKTAHKNSQDELLGENHSQSKTVGRQKKHSPQRTQRSQKNTFREDWLLNIFAAFAFFAVDTFFFSYFTRRLPSLTDPGTRHAHDRHSVTSAPPLLQRSVRFPKCTRAAPEQEPREHFVPR